MILQLPPQVIDGRTPALKPAAINWAISWDGSVHKRRTASSRGRAAVRLCSVGKGTPMVASGRNLVWGNLSRKKGLFFCNKKIHFRNLVWGNPQKKDEKNLYFLATKNTFINWTTRSRLSFLQIFEKWETHPADEVSRNSLLAAACLRGENFLNFNLIYFIDFFSFLNNVFFA